MTTGRIHEYASETDATISSTVRALASGRNITPETVALGVGMTRSSIYNRLKGTAPWKASEVVAVAQFFSVRLTDLYDGLSGRFGPSDPSPAGTESNKGKVHCFKPYLTVLDGGGLITDPVKPALKLVSDAA
jgi:hypothetical protein